MKCTGKFFSLTFLHRNKCFHCFSLPGILVPASEFPVHVPVPNKYARIPVPAIYPGTGSAQPLSEENNALEKHVEEVFPQEVKVKSAPDRLEAKDGDGIVEGVLCRHVHQPPAQAIVREYQEHLK